MATGDDLELGASNSANRETFLHATARRAAGLLVTNSGGGNAANPATGVRGDGEVGVRGVGGHTGVLGESSSGTAVRGKANGGTGVKGESNSGVGVEGRSGNRSGVRGFSDSSNGVRGDSNSGVGVRGESNGDTGVRGVGRWGVSAQGGTQGVGVIATGGVGVVGASTASNGVGVWGGSQSGFAVLASSGAGFAGFFEGNVFIDGDLTKTGAGSCVAVPFPDGSLRKLYSIESPESWFEDFGEKRLVNGRAQVALDRGFAGVVRGEYHVFVTPYGDSKGLYVSRRTRRGFEVREQQGGTSSLVFSYRVVARRKNIPGPRFERVRKVTPPAKPPQPADPEGRAPRRD